MSNYHYKPPKNAPITNQKLFDDLKSVCESLGTRKLSQKVYDENGNFSVATYKKRFGSWNNALEQAGLEITEKIKKISLDDLVNDLKHISNKLYGKKLTQNIYRQYGRYDVKTYKSRFGTWNKALKKAGLEVSAVGKYSIEELFENIKKVWDHKSDQPSQDDMDNKKISRIGVSTYKYRFGSWSKALKAFIKHVNNDDSEFPKEEYPRISTKETKGKKESRHISKTVKNEVWNRDKGKCVQCGLNEKLEFDHIIPHSKGGANTYRNIQLLCESCNRKKSAKIG